MNIFQRTVTNVRQRVRTVDRNRLHNRTSHTPVGIYSRVFVNKD